MERTLLRGDTTGADFENANKMGAFPVSMCRWSASRRPEPTSPSTHFNSLKRIYGVAKFEVRGSSSTPRPCHW
jgi:hypothetical protein